MATKQKVDRSVHIGEADRLVSHLEMFRNAAEIIKQAHADEAGIVERERTIDALQQQIEGAEAELSALQQDIEDLKRKKEEETKRLEQAQVKRSQEAQSKASRDIADAEQRRQAKLQSVNQEIAVLNQRLREAREETEQEEYLLSEAKKKREEFVRSVTR